MLTSFFAALVVQDMATGVRPSDPDLRPIVITGELTADVTRSNVADDNVVLFDADALAALGADDVGQVLQFVPNLVNPGNSQAPTLRGTDTTGVLNNLPASLGGGRARATLDLDGRSLGYFEYVFSDPPIWDAQSVSVVRGPLLTTLARPSIAGGIFLRSREPTDRLEAAMRLQAGSLDRRQVAGMANFPLAMDGALALRLTADHSTGRPASDIAERMVGASPNRLESTRLTARLGYGRSDAFRALVGVSRLHTQAPQSVGILPPYEERRDPRAGYGIFGITAQSLTLAFDGKFGGGDWTAQASLGDTDIRRFAPPSLGELRSDLSDRSIASAVRFDLGSAGLLLGTRIEAADQQLRIDLAAASAGVGTFDDDVRDAGAFASLHVPLLARLDLNLGARLQHYSQVRSGALVGNRPDRPLDYRGSWTTLLPSISLVRTFGTDHELQFTIERGFNPGGVTINPVTGFQDEFDRETLRHVELSFKSRPASSLFLSANLFHDLMRDAQRPLMDSLLLPDGSTIEVVQFTNAPRARAIGAEVQLEWAANERLTLNASGALLDTKILRTPLADPTLGKSFARAAPWSFAAGARWTPADHWDVAVTARGHGPYFSDDAQTLARRVDAAVIFDARIARRFGDLEVSAYVRNLADRFALTNISSDTRATAVNPREIGITLTARR